MSLASSHRWSQFSLRSGLILMVVVGMVASKDGSDDYSDGNSGGLVSRGEVSMNEFNGRLILVSPPVCR
jgi:hypothetical protein